MRKKLIIISHTAHYLKDGQAMGWGPTITEINYLSQYWEEVVHIACLHSEKSLGGSLPYTFSNIRFVSIPPFGGPRWQDKLGILFKMLGILKKIREELNGATEVQLRLPTGIGVFLLPWFSIRKRNFTFWVKYAGNWAQEHPPLGYGFIRWWLKRNLARCKVTINGHWPNQPKHCLSFENPCLYEEDLIAGKETAIAKRFEAPYRLIFIGRLEEAKGVGRILKALEQINPSWVKEMHFIGDGEKKAAYQKRANTLQINTYFHGFLNRTRVHDLLMQADFILLPSDSEGFPKVIAEAACYGVIPVVSAVASIPQYIQEKNGYLWKTNTPFTPLLKTALQRNINELKKQSISLSELSLKFGYSVYHFKLEKEVFLNEKT